MTAASLAKNIVRLFARAGLWGAIVVSGSFALTLLTLPGFIFLLPGVLCLRSLDPGRFPRFEIFGPASLFVNWLFWTVALAPVVRMHEQKKRSPAG